MLCKETAKTIASFILWNIVYYWGTLLEIVTDNGAPFVKALSYLKKHYCIKHICISGYNSRANGLVEQSHLDICQALFKACDGEESKWSSTAYSVFWAERVTVCQWMGCSPYFATTGAHPLLPFNIAEANYLLPPPPQTQFYPLQTSYHVVQWHFKRDALNLLNYMTRFTVKCFMLV